jgi:hypothetical protein
MSKYTLTVSFNTPEELAAYIGAKTGSVAAPTPAPAAAPAAEKPAAAEKKADKQKADKSPPKQKHTRDEMNTALNEVKDAKGIQAAKDLISTVGGVSLKADIPDDKIDAVYDAAKAAVEESAAIDDDM